MNCNISVTLIKSFNQSSINPCLFTIAIVSKAELFLGVIGVFASNVTVQ